MSSRSPLYTSRRPSCVQVVADAGEHLRAGHRPIGTCGTWTRRKSAPPVTQTRPPAWTRVSPVMIGSPFIIGNHPRDQPTGATGRIVISGPSTSTEWFVACAAFARLRSPRARDRRGNLLSRNARSPRHLQRGSWGGGGHRAYKALIAVVLALVAVALLVWAVQAFAGRHLALLEVWSGGAWLFELITTAVAFAGLITVGPWAIVLLDRRRSQTVQTTQVALFIGALLITLLAFVASVALLPPRGGCPPDESSFPCVFLARHANVPFGWAIGLTTGTLIGGLITGAVSRRRTFASIRRDTGRHSES